MVSFGGVAVGEIGYAADVPVAAAGRLYGVDGTDLYRSLDAGDTWTSIKTFTTEGSLTHAFDVLAGAAEDGSQDVIVVGDRTSDVPGWTPKLHVSLDGGAAWSVHTPPGGSDSLPAFAGVVSATEWVLCCQGGGNFRTDLFRTTNSGGSYATYAATVLVDGSRYADQGKVWALYGGASGFGPARVNPDGSGYEDLEVAATDYNRCIPISATACLYYSTNGGGPGGYTFALATYSGGLAWAVIPPTGVSTLWDADYNIVGAWSPDDGATIYAVVSDGTTGQVLKRTGGTWTQIHASATVRTTNSDPGVMDGRDGSPTTLWLLGTAGLVRSTDGGATWAVADGAHFFDTLQAVG